MINFEWEGERMEEFTKDLSSKSSLEAWVGIPVCASSKGLQ